MKKRHKNEDLIDFQARRKNVMQNEELKTKPEVGVLNNQRKDLQ